MLIILNNIIQSAYEFEMSLIAIAFAELINCCGQHRVNASEVNAYISSVKTDVFLLRL